MNSHQSRTVTAVVCSRVDCTFLGGFSFARRVKGDVVRRGIAALRPVAFPQVPDERRERRVAERQPPTVDVQIQKGGQQWREVCRDMHRLGEEVPRRERSHIGCMLRFLAESVYELRTAERR